MLILASGSPRRRDLLLRERLSFCVITREVDELQTVGLSPQELCARNAKMKAEAVSSLFPRDIVVGADTLVFLDGEPLGKPRDLDDARAMLTLLVEVPVLDKAGAYAMQEKSELIVEAVQGDVDNVIGLPVTRLLRVLFS